MRNEETEEIQHENGTTRKSFYKSVPFVNYPSQQQFGEVKDATLYRDGNTTTHIIGGIESHPDTKEKSEIRYNIQLRGRNTPNAISYVKVEIDLKGGYGIDFSYECNEAGVPLQSPRRKSMNLSNVGCFKGGEWYEPDADFVNQVRDLLQPFGFIQK